MSSEREADLARERHSDFLRELGAHAVGVDEVRRGGEKTFAVIAYFEERPAESLPKTLEVKSGGRTFEVPLALKVEEKFRPE